MKPSIKCIMLIDDDPDDNFFHERVIRKLGTVETIIVMETATDAIDYLKSEKNDCDGHPDVIILDINMPGMDGWEFLDEYRKIEEHQRCLGVIIMLTTSANPADRKKAELLDVIAAFKTKPLTAEMLDEIITIHNS